MYRNAIYTFFLRSIYLKSQNQFVDDISATLFGYIRHQSLWNNLVKLIKYANAFVFVFVFVSSGKCKGSRHEWMGLSGFVLPTLI